jgi:ubiquinone/menaquinone biosynthesis C-methylase UbiE/uncharacterized protein YbaR (Trm112 family)
MTSPSLIGNRLDTTLLSWLACPLDQGELTIHNDHLVCGQCGRQYRCSNGIPILLADESAQQTALRGTRLFEDSAEYFERLHIKRLHEWGTAPFLSERFTTQDAPLLDVGSGAGTFVLAMGKRGITSIGMDISLHGARHGLAAARQGGIVHCHFVVGDAAHLPFKSNAFRSVTNYTTIEHVYDPGACLKEMARVAAPAGRILVNTINNFSLHTRLGWGTALRQFFREAIVYLISNSGHKPARPFTPRPTESVTVQAWKSGEDLDIYHTRSYDLLRQAKEQMDIEFYTSHSYPENGRRYHLAPGLNIEASPLPWPRSFLYRCLAGLRFCPVLRHVGKTITLIGRKRPT